MLEILLTDFEVPLHVQSTMDSPSVSELRGGKQETTMLYNNWKVLTDWFCPNQIKNNKNSDLIFGSWRKKS
jgi:hypothetical protein